MEPASNRQAKKLWSLVNTLAAQGKCSYTFGALDTIQVTQMAPHVSTIYVSGWQCSSTASTSNEPGPDFADYPMDTVPNKVHQLFSAQLFHDRRQREERARMTEAQLTSTPAIDYLRPIIADGDTGHGYVECVCVSHDLVEVEACLARLVLYAKIRLHFALSMTMKPKLQQWFDCRHEADQDVY